jgi:hypothetical protein
MRLHRGPGPSKNNQGKKESKRRAAGCYLLRWRWANNPLALPIYLLLIPPRSAQLLGVIEHR